ncbi:GSCFA domain-containing protein [Magnetovibrio sp.]|uniref:GSCFA domain-containing protein n=1 Tax=Magnetovibrio sp. TaxID=2024836 RepID=UPI002F95F337
MAHQPAPSASQKFNESAIIDLSSSNTWNDQTLLGLMIEGLRKDGFEESTLAHAERLLHQHAPKSSEEFIKILNDDAQSCDAKLGDEIKRIAAFHTATVTANSTCYLRESPEKTRTIQWPNNQSAKVNDPSNYFDIYEDFFYKTPHRFITKDTPIGSLGSCFALRIAHQLQAWNYNYVIEEDDLPAEIPLEELHKTSYRMAPARTGTLFNTPSMRQVIQRGFGEWMPDFLITRKANGGISDPFRTVPVPSEIDAYIADQKTHNAALQRAMQKCDVMVLTLGLTEAWHFAHSGDYLSISPWQIDPALIRQKNLTVEENVAELETILATYKRHKPDIKLIISVSPVPLNKTFSKDSHVVSANCHSKSVLRVAAEQFVRNNPDHAFYFPSYEMVTYGTRSPWESDMRHVSNEAVGRVMALFQKMFFVEQTPLPLLQHAEPPMPKKQHVKSLLRKAAGPLLPTIRRVRRGLK